MAKNSVAALKAFFSTADKPVSTKEMMDFWKPLSDEEKAYYQTADLS